MKDKKYYEILNSRDCLEFITKVNGLDDESNYEVRLINLLDLGNDEIIADFEILCKILKYGLLSTGKAHFKSFSCDITTSLLTGYSKTTNVYTKDYAEFMYEKIREKTKRKECDFSKTKYLEEYNDHWTKVRDDEIKKIEEEYESRVCHLPSSLKDKEMGEE